MKVAILTLGSRGDVQPYVALARELIMKGHEAKICTGASFRQFILENGVDFHKAEADLMALLESKEGKDVFNGGRYRLFKILKYAKEVITPAYRKSMDDFLAASADSDLIIYHPKTLVAPDIAEYLGIPCISLPPIPAVYPISEFPNIAVTADKNLGSVLNRLSYKATAFGETPYMKQINEFREECLHLPKRKAGKLAYEVNGKKIPIIYPISPYLFQQVQSWRDKVYLSGFFFMDIGEAKLDEALLDYLESGSKPIVVSFSSMPLKDPDAFAHKLIRALKETGDRAVVLTGTSGLDFKNEDCIFSMDRVPHRLIFSRAKGIIHHGGVGTMSEALLSGVPQLMIPFAVDQPFWANLLHSKGYALKPLKESTLEISDLVKALRDMEDEKYKKKAKEIREIVASENGLKNAAAYIESVFCNYMK